jgi:hypothetical protein
MDVAQWRFFVVPRRRLDTYARSQYSITLPSLEKLGVCAVSYSELEQAFQGGLA